jgi:hypothetical protein
MSLIENAPPLDRSGTGYAQKVRNSVNLTMAIMACEVKMAEAVGGRIEPK